MENKKTNYQDTFNLFKKAVKDMNFQLPLLHKFFYRVSPFEDNLLTEKLAQSIEGGVSKYSYKSDEVCRMSQRTNLNLMRGKAIHVVALLAMMQRDEDPPLEGDLVLVVNRCNGFRIHFT